MTIVPRAAAAPGGVALGIRANLGQFLLLILVNAFVGGMVGLERTVVPPSFRTRSANWSVVAKIASDCSSSIRW